jgi:hypothetical protein
MKARFIVLVLMLVGVFGVGAIATRGDNIAPDKQWALINFADPTIVAGEVLMGQFLVVHDSQKMSRGEPCSTFYRFDKKRGPQEAIVSFHCRPVQREVCAKTTLTVRSDPAFGIAKLVEYQVAGDSEAHGVPLR